QPYGRELAQPAEHGVAPTADQRRPDRGRTKPEHSTGITDRHDVSRPMQGLLRDEKPISWQYSKNRRTGISEEPASLLPYPIRLQPGVLPSAHPHSTSLWRPRHADPAGKPWRPR